MFSIMILSCGEKHTYIDKEYEGFWAETDWHYDFNKDGTFTFKTVGHYGHVTQTGKYAIIDDKIVLSPNSDWQSLHGVLATRLKIVNEDCIRDYDNNYYCKDISKIDIIRENEFKFQDSVALILDTLDIVLHEKRRVNSRKTEEEKIKLKIVFDKILLVNGEDYQVFSLYGIKERSTMDYDEYTFLNFLVKKQPFEIYQHHSSGDSLALVYKK